ncbi:hypothetical protein GGQ60_000557 [Pedobacter zeae]|uniref:Uncharacterized protein n=1 Tax=Pedobacter zeae TaxID=1737356 RepID=A0A7W6P451_9SPHI|nr:hypothetical protein [Pedobacter zeae]
MMRYIITITLIIVFNSAFSQTAKIEKEKWHWNGKTQDSTA